MALIYPEDSDRYDLFRANFMNSLAHMICSVQPISRESIGDPTRGYENIFNLSYWSLKYEEKQNMMWQDDGGPCLAN